MSSVYPDQERANGNSMRQMHLLQKLEEVAPNCSPDMKAIVVDQTINQNCLFYFENILLVRIIHVTKFFFSYVILIFFLPEFIHQQL